MALSAEQIVDLVTTTQRELGRMRWTDLTSDLQEYIALPQVLKKERVSFDSGVGIQWNVQVDHSNAAKNVGLYQVDDTNVGDTMKTANAPWRHTMTDYAFDRREISMNRSPSKIVDLVKTRRAASMISLAELMEENFWGKPVDSTDEVTPYGIDMWAVSNATEGFYGGNPSGFTSGVGNLSAVTYPRWRNWSATYTAISKVDLIRKWRKAGTYCRFKSPIKISDYNTGDRYGYYTNYDVVGAIEEILEDQNDNLGNDVASKDGAAMFRRRGITWVPYLDADSTDPVIGINWGVFKPVFLRGEYMREEPPARAAKQHNVFEVFVDCTYNFICKDRRKLFRLNK